MNHFVEFVFFEIARTIFWVSVISAILIMLIISGGV